MLFMFTTLQQVWSEYCVRAPSALRSWSVRNTVITGISPLDSGLLVL
jgi:hypothetical protein